jgi:hypothetical protein
MSRLASLPDDLLKIVMHSVPLQDRLGSCCLVSKKLQAAAVAATDDLQLLLDKQASRKQTRVDSVLEWLPHHGQQLTRLSLELGLSSQLIRQLPCQHLLELKLLECDIQLGAADGFPGVIEGCSKLTRLELECNILDAPERAVMDGLSSLVHLQHFNQSINVTLGCGACGTQALCMARRIRHCWFVRCNPSTAAAPHMPEGQRAQH